MALQKLECCCWRCGLVGEPKRLKRTVQAAYSQVVGITADSKGIVSVVLVRTFPRYPAPITKPNYQKGLTRTNNENQRQQQQGGALHTSSVNTDSF